MHRYSACFAAELFADILTIMPDKKGWSNRALARKLAESGVDIPQLRVDDIPKYKRSRHTEGGRVTEIDQHAGDDEDEDMMEVDQDPTPKVEEFFIPSHALDALHLQVIDHFTLLLRETTQRVRISAGESEVSQSLHAPAYRRKEFALWTLADCLEYLDLKKKPRPCNPPLHRFLLPRCSVPGTRRGQDWTHQDWKNVVAALEEIGTKCDDGAVLGSVEYLKQEAAYVFSLQLRPTGQ